MWGVPLVTIGDDDSALQRTECALAPPQARGWAYLAQTGRPPRDSAAPSPGPSKSIVRTREAGLWRQAMRTPMSRPIALAVAALALSTTAGCARKTGKNDLPYV